VFVMPFGLLSLIEALGGANDQDIDPGFQAGNQ